MSERVRSLTGEDDVQWGATTHASFLGQGAWERVDQSQNDLFLCLRIHLHVALSTAMKREAAVPILDRSGLRSDGEDSEDHCRPCLGVTLRSDGLVTNGRDNIVVHCHRLNAYQRVLLDELKARAPVVLSTETEDSIHFLLGWGPMDARGRVHGGLLVSERSRV